MEKVTPLAGVWVEIALVAALNLASWSLPLRECGLKLVKRLILKNSLEVTPLAGVWVEIVSSLKAEAAVLVTPLAGVWVEINVTIGYDTTGLVTPLAGVWVEI